MKNIIINAVKILLGLGIIVSAIIAYLPDPQYMYELTCISNSLGGALLIVDGIIGLLRKGRLHSIAALSISTCLFVVLLICSGTFIGLYHFNFEGAFLLLHLINPIVVLAWYLTCFNEWAGNFKKRIRLIFAAPLPVIAYLIFDYVRSFFTGDFVYGLLDIKEMSVLNAAIVGVSAYALVLALSLGLLWLNRLLHIKSKNRVSNL